MRIITSRRIILVLLLFATSVCFAEETIQGHYCYTYGDNETLKEAREVTRTLAIRDAIESYRVFVESTSTVKDFKLTNDLIQSISSGYLKNIKVIEHKEKGRTVCCTIQANVSMQEIEKIIERQIEKRRKKVEGLGIDSNSYLKILGIKRFSVSPTESRIKVILKVLQGKPSSSNMWPSVHFKLFADFYDSEGDPIISTQSKYICIDSEELFPGEIRTNYFILPPGAKSYRVWLMKK